eukprot:SAG22_NODE_1027_length_5962_cov_53.268293_2_plen_87_part_00
MSYLIAPFKFGFDIGERGGPALHRTYDIMKHDHSKGLKVIFKLFLLFILPSLKDFLALDNLIIVIGLADHRRLRVVLLLLVKLTNL